MRPAEALPGDLAAQVEQATSARITAVRPRGGGGASREGAELTLAWPDGRVVEAYMNYDVQRAGAGDDAAFLREAGVLRALSNDAPGLRVARFIAAIPESRALIAERVAGEANFNRLAPGQARSAVAADYMAQLAHLHAIDPASLPLDVFGEPAFDAMVDARLAGLRTRRAAGDPLTALALQWLGAHRPAPPPRISIVHGDAGPANFLFDADKVTALLDWELVHLGDPMADLAMICLRTLFQPFVALPEAFAAYEAAGGAPVDLDQVRWWRILFQTQFSGIERYADPAAPAPPNLGMNLVYTTIHRRVLAEALAEVAGIALPPVALPDPTAGARDRSYAIALDDLRDTIVPRVGDQQASTKAKGLARLVKYWRAADRFGASFAEAERSEIDAALGTTSADLSAARQALAVAVTDGSIDFAAALALCHAREVRESRLMADATGSLVNARFAPLS